MGSGKLRTIGRLVIAAAVATIALAGFAAGPAQAGGSCHLASATTGAGIRVDIKELCFTPVVLYARKGETVTWTNRDPVDHTVTGLGFSWGSSGSLTQGQSVTYRFTEAGVYPYSCVLHPGMVGAVVVGNPKAPASSAAIPLAVPSRPPAASAAAKVAPVVEPASSSSVPWRIVALVSVVLLAGAVLGLATQQQKVRRARSAVAG
jgi:plastocyanin